MVYRRSRPLKDPTSGNFEYFILVLVSSPAQGRPRVVDACFLRSLITEAPEVAEYSLLDCRIVIVHFTNKLLIHYAVHVVTVPASLSQQRLKLGAKLILESEFET
jgi:hypothetical protein